MSCDCNTLIVGEAGPQGPQGLAGTNGTNGTNGINAFTTLTTQFTQPSVSGTVTIVVGDNRWIAVGQAIYISDAGFYKVTAVGGSPFTAVTCDLEKEDGVNSGGNVTSGRKISPSAIATYAGPLTSLTVNGDGSQTPDVNLDGSVTINASGANKDFIVEGDTDPYLLVSDASVDRVGVGIQAPETKCHISGGFKVGTTASPSDALFTRAVTVNDSQNLAGNFIVKTQSRTNALVVNASTNCVGVATLTPSKLFDVEGSMETNALLVNPGAAGAIDGTQYVFKVSGSGNATPLVVDATNNRVGVNISAPTVTVDISGAARISGNVAVNTSTLFVNTSLNRVGIHTSSPTQTLDVDGTVNISDATTMGSTLNVSGVTTLSSVAISSATISGNLSVDTNVLFVDASNNFVGVNTNTPVTNASLVVAGGNFIVDSNVLFVNTATNRVGINQSTPSVSLDVSGSAIISNSLIVGPTLNVNDSSNQVSVGTLTPASGATLTVAGGDLVVSGSSNLIVNTSSFFVDASTQKVGINNNSPTTALDVGGTVSINGALQRNAPVTKISDFSVSDTENWLIVDQAATVTVTLPTASSWTGREIMIKTVQAQAVNSNATNVIPLVGGAAGSGILTNTAGKWATLVSNGSNWEIMAGN